MADHVQFDASTGIATVTLGSLTMPPSFFEHVGRVFRDLATKPDLRVVVVRSTAKSFSYGLDLGAAFAEMGKHFDPSSGAAGRLELLALVGRLQEGFTAIAECPVPVIAAIHGACIGGGLDLVTACDLRLATIDARFSLRETKMAIVADLGSLQRLPRIVGQGHARELAFTGKDVSATRAREIGLVNEVYADVASLHAAADALAREIAANPPLTVRGVKRVLDHGDGKSVADGLAFVALWNSAFLASEDLGEAIGAFGEKRAPAYKGR